MKKIFITATDTDAGKTFISCAILHAMSAQRHRETNKPLKVSAFKPIAAGCDLIDGQLINEDAKLLSQFANAGQTIQQINPIAFEEAIAPHIAAKKKNQVLHVEEIDKHYQQVKLINADLTLVEGAGGWRLPLGIIKQSENNCEADSTNQQKNLTTSKKSSKIRYQYLSDFVKGTDLQVVLIVNMKLGCLNHALLTYETIIADGLECIGWIANCASSEPMSNLVENIRELENLLPIPKLGQCEYVADTDEQGKKISLLNKIKLASKSINVSPLLPRKV